MEQAAQIAQATKYSTTVSKWPCNNTWHKINKHRNRVKNQ